MYLAANVANAAIPFLLLPVLTRVLSPEDYGRVAMFSIAVSVLSAFTGLSVHGAISVRFFQLDPPRLASYVGTCVSILWLSTLLVAVIVMAAGPWLERGTDIPTAWLVVAVVTSASQVAAAIRLSLWQVQGKALRYALFQVAVAAANALLSLVFVLVLLLGWQGRVLGQAAPVLLFGALAMWMMKGDIARPFQKGDARDALHFGVPLIPHVLGTLMISVCDRILIANVLDVAQVGVYMVALQIGMVLGMATESFNKAYSPWLMGVLARGDRGAYPGIVRGAYLYFVALLVIAVLIGLAAPHVMSILVGEEFRSASDAVLYIALGFAFSGMYYMVTGYIFFASRTASLAGLTLAAGLLNVLVTWRLVLMNGVTGAAQAFMISQAVLFIGAWCLAQRSYPMPWLGSIFTRAVAVERRRI